ncbi:MAG: orotate phosphoribosyltransferase [Flavobacteriales bacterium]|nr:orotate phosphoribosyltransferase [Flavobacteriales bacterium]|tara:strand:- start:2033 stop:2653 length:621 start_codon:yes stop_codon:yes gene_type:complete
MIVNKNDAQKVANILLKINAVNLQPSNFFTWTSGKKSPIYCDNRVVLSYVRERKIIIDLFCYYIKKKFTSIDYIAGVATGAIPYGMLIASNLELPFIYVRDKAKNYGRQNQIEGHLKQKSQVIVIEDLISTGKSSMNAIDAIEKKGSKVCGLMSVFTYNFFDTNDLTMPYIPLCNFSTLINVAVEKKIIKKEEITILQNWHSKNLI